jgi:hypothetical protein
VRGKHMCVRLEPAVGQEGGECMQGEGAGGRCGHTAEGAGR